MKEEEEDCAESANFFSANLRLALNYDSENLIRNG